MSDGALSQDEIDALLQGTDDSSFDLDAGGFDSLDDGGSLSQPEIKALQDLINNATANVGDALGAMVEKKITITNPRIEVINSVSLANQLPDQFSKQYLLKFAFDRLYATKLNQVFAILVPNRERRID